jgi:hypothetical protein
MLQKRLFSVLRVLHHENPLGLPQSGTPPSFPRRRGLPEKRKIRDVKKVIAVSSAKGGVGKSTIAGMKLCLIYHHYSFISAVDEPPRTYFSRSLTFLRQ